MASGAAASVAGIVDRVEGRPHRTGRPPLPTVEVVETLRFFAREGVQWRGARGAGGGGPGAGAGRAGGPTPRRRLDEWSGTALLRRVHVALVRMVRAGPGAAASWDVVVDGCSVRAERGGEPTGPNPTDRGEAGTEYRVIASTDGLPPGVVPSAADVHGTRLFPRLPRRARVVCAAIGRLCADAAGACPPAGGAGPGGQRGEPRPSPAGRHPALHPAGRRAARLGARHRPPPGGARLRLAAGRQAAGPAAGQARPRDPGPADRRLHLPHREPPRPVLETAPNTPLLRARPGCRRMSPARSSVSTIRRTAGGLTRNWRCRPASAGGRPWTRV